MAVKKKSVKKTSRSKTKKAVKKKTAKKTVKKLPNKTMSKKTVKRTAPVSQARRIKATPARINLVLKNLILFVVVTIISYILYLVSNNFIYDSFFYLLSMVSGFISLAFLISLLVLLFLRVMRK